MTIENDEILGWGTEKIRHGSERIKRGFAKMVKGGVIMDVTNAEQAQIAEDAGAVAVMALERVPADIRAEGGVARMADPTKIEEIIDSVTIPVMAKCRIGHTEEARALEALGVDMIDESEVLTPADPFYHVDKRPFTIPFVCGCRTLGEAVRRVWEGAAMIRTKGEAGTGDIIEAMRHYRHVDRAIKELTKFDDDMLYATAEHFAKNYLRLSNLLVGELGIKKDDYIVDPVFGEYTYEEITDGLLKLLKEIKKLQRLPVVNFTAGGIATPADAALMMRMGSDGVFVGSGIFKSDNPPERAKAIVEATAHWDDPSVVAEVSRGLGDAMKGISVDSMAEEEKIQGRGW